MKKLSTYIVMLVMGLATFSFSGCTEDQLIGMTLEGTWRGDMDIYHTYGGKKYEAVWSEICFVGDPFRLTQGTGYWYDQYDGYYFYGRNYTASRIRWKVSNGIIYVDFDDYTSIEIRDYTLNDNRFIGTIWAGGNIIDFNLYHVNNINYDSYDYYDWDWYWNNYAKGDNGKVAAPEPPMRHFGDPDKK